MASCLTEILLISKKLNANDIANFSSSQSSHWFGSSVTEIESNFPDNWTPSGHKNGKRYVEPGQGCHGAWVASHTVALSPSSLWLALFRLDETQDEMECTIILKPFIQVMLEG